ncbi:MAG: hypothetical protein AAF206_25180 [Bacteroidota bacterium]
METRSYPKQLWRVWAMILVCLLPLAASAQEISRVIEKAFELSPNSVIDIRNKYGNVDIKNWDEDFARVTVTIQAKGNSPERAARRLEEVDIQERFVGNLIQLETRILSQSILQQAIPHGIKVHYDVKMPIDHSVAVVNRYGDIYVDDRNGNVSIDLKHGNLVAERLDGAENQIMMRFGDADVAFFSGGKVDFSFGELVAGSADVMELKSNGAKVYIDEVEKLSINANLGEIELDDVAHVSGQYKASRFLINNLSKSMDLKVDAALSFDVEHIHSGFEDIKLKGNYTVFNLGFEPDAAFTLDAELDHAKFTPLNMDDMNVAVEDGEGKASFVKAKPISVARVGKQGQVKVEAKYGNLRLTRRL